MVVEAIKKTAQKRAPGGGIFGLRTGGSFGISAIEPFVQVEVTVEPIQAAPGNALD
jgi:hypothetical protein